MGHAAANCLWVIAVSWLVNHCKLIGYSLWRVNTWYTFPVVVRSRLLNWTILTMRSVTFPKVILIQFSRFTVPNHLKIQFQSEYRVSRPKLESSSLSWRVEMLCTRPYSLVNWDISLLSSSLISAMWTFQGYSISRNYWAFYWLTGNLNTWERLISEEYQSD